jgi:AcrR family transcriptional regulator
MSTASVPQSYDLPASRGGKRERQKLIHREAILEAGERVLGADLRECVAVDKIAAEAGLAKGTVYNYFGHKAVLVEAVTQRVESRVVERLDRAIWDLSTAGARVATAICAMFETAARYPEEAVILVRRIGAAGSYDSLIGRFLLTELKNRAFHPISGPGARRAALILILSAICSGMREVLCSQTRCEAIEIQGLIARCLVALGIGEEDAMFEARGAWSRLDWTLAPRDCGAT